MPNLRQATRTRFNLARNISCSLEHDSNILAVIATGSVARNRCSRNSDLDLTVITANHGVKRSVTSEKREDVTIDIEWLTLRRALSIVKGGKRDLQGLREASRLGLGVFILDRSSFESNFRTLAVNLLPDRTMLEQRMAALSSILADLSLKRSSSPEVQWEGFRGLVDNLAFVLLVMHPFRYHKPKWVMADLRDAGYQSLNSLLRKAYRIGSNSPIASCRSIEQSRQFIEGMGQLMKVPSIGYMLNRGFTRKYAAWSYICRTWEDATSLFQDKDFVEASFTAKFAVRMAISFFFQCGKWKDAPTNLVTMLDKLKNDQISDLYRRLFTLPVQHLQFSQEMAKKSLDLFEVCGRLKEQIFAEEY